MVLALIHSARWHGFCKKQPLEVHPFDIACGGIGQQPIKVAARVPMSTVLTQLSPWGRNRVRAWRAMFEIITNVNDKRCMLWQFDPVEEPHIVGYLRGHGQTEMRT